MAAPPRPGQAPSADLFDAYFRRADLDRDGRISGAEAVAFFQGSNLPTPVLAQIWTYADQNRIGFLGRPEFYNYLRLVTVAQSGRELTPDMVKAALFGPAASQIPAPKINPVSAPTPQMNSMATPPRQLNTMVPPAAQVGSMGPTTFQNPGVRGQQPLPNTGMNHFTRPPQATPTLPAASLPVQGLGQRPPGGGSVGGPQFSSSSTPNLSTDWLGGRAIGAPVGVTSQIPVRGAAPLANQDGFGRGQLGTTPGVAQNSQTFSVSSSLVERKPLDSVMSSSKPAVNTSRALVASGNGFSSDSVFGGEAFSATPQAKQEASTSVFSSSSMPNTSSAVAVATGTENSTTPGPSSLQGPFALSSIGTQLQSTQSLVKQNQLGITQSTSALAVSSVTAGPSASVSSQSSERPWPRTTQSDIQKYTSVFVKVDKDRDGKITGEEARNLFLSWRLPREVLKQVWDLADQDNDSMLSLREFCTALYLMERYREGRPLPAVLPNSVRFDETLLLSTGQPSTAHSGPAWQQNPGLTQQVVPGPRPVMPSSEMRPPVQNSKPPLTDDAGQLVQQKARVPVLEKNLLNQLSKEEQDALNSRFQEATDADKKVQELEKEILESREKIEFYRTKMQELVLYKSRCDNRLNEITERVSADRREVESLAKKYEEKYKQAGDVASKLTLDEATFRDIQERKLELYNAIVKMEQGGTADGVLQDRADRIQSDLEEVVKNLNERCKQYGLRAKPTTLIELPFGWQPGIQEGAADWDENWDKFDDEGYAIIKELTVEVENVVAKPKAPVVRSDKESADEVSAVPPSSNGESKSEKPSSSGEPITQSELSDAHSENGSARSPDTPKRSILESPSQEYQSTHSGTQQISPRAKDTRSDHGGTEAESTISGDKYADEPSWGATFDSTDEVDSLWGFNPIKTKATDHEGSRQDLFFGSGDFGLNPSRTDSPSAGSVFGNDRRGPFFDSVPSTPLYNSGFSPRFSDGPEDHAFDSFSRFDSFSMHENTLFPQSGSLGRFDSMRSTADHPVGSFARFDSMRSTAEPPVSLTRFDSMRSTSDYGHGFPSFDDADPFGSTGPFKSSESHTPRQGTDSWSAF